jgi:hypothetical protein
MRASALRRHVAHGREPGQAQVQAQVGFQARVESPANSALQKLPPW